MQGHRGLQLSSERPSFPRQLLTLRHDKLPVNGDWLALLFDQCLAGLLNRTLDDVFGDPMTRQLSVFLPENMAVWTELVATAQSIGTRGSYTTILTFGGV
jgi:hypothetical protein